MLPMQRRITPIGRNNQRNKNTMAKVNIEKAHQVGDMHPNGKWTWTEYKPGKFDWRPVKGGAAKKNEGAGGGSSSAAAQKTSSESAAAKTDTTSGAEDAKGAGEEKKVEEKPYDAPKPTIEYKTKKPADGLMVRVPESWEVTPKGGGKRVPQHRDKLRAIYADKTKKDDQAVIDMVNKTHASKFVRMIAYEEAMARGIAEDKLNIDGTLKEWWDSLEEKRKLLAGEGENASEEDYEDYDTSALRGMDVEAFMSQFPEGDMGWADRSDERVQKEFNKLTTISDRQRYDAFLDYQRRADPLYRSPKQQIQSLNRQLFHFMTSKKSPMFVSAGGAGAGKTTSMLKVAKVSGLEQFDPSRHKPGDGDYDFVIVDKDIEDVKDLLSILSKHNGKLLIFDDKDKLLTSRSSPIISQMKSLADGNPKMRLFKDPATGEPTRFTGQLMFITNKTMDTLNDNEDHKAIMSRASKNDIHFTINENIEILEERYKTMGPKMESVDAAEEEQIREKLFRTIKANRDKLDPDKFTVRKFTEALEYIDGIEATNKQEDDQAEELFGEKMDWTQTIVRDVLNKATDVDDMFEKGVKEEIASELSDSKTRKKMLAVYKKNPKLAKELFGEDVLKVLNEDKEEKKEETDEEVVKAFEDSLNEMTMEQAEQILGL